MARTVMTIHVFLHLAEICLQIEAAVKYRESGGYWHIVIICLALIPLLAVNVTSMLWIYKRLDFDKDKLRSCSCVIFHILQFGPVWRYFQLIIAYEDEDYEEILALRHIQALIQTGPFLLIQVFLTLHLYQNAFVISCSVVSLLSLSLVFASYREQIYNLKITGTDNQQKDESSSPTAENGKPIANSNRKPDTERFAKLRRDICRIIVQLLWRIFMLVSRVTALALFALAKHFWVFIPIGVHFLMFLFWYLGNDFKRSSRQQRTYKHRLMDIKRAYGQIFDIINCKGNDRLRVVFLYYFLVILENATCTVLALAFDHDLATTDYKLAILGTVFGAFLLGCIFVIIFYSFCAPKNHKPRCRAVCCKFNIKRRKGGMRYENENNIEIEHDDFAWDDYDGDLPRRSTGYVNKAFESDICSASRHHSATINSLALETDSFKRKNPAKSQCSNLSAPHSINTLKRRSSVEKHSSTSMETINKSVFKHNSITSSNSRNTNTVDTSCDSMNRSLRHKHETQTTSSLPCSPMHQDLPSNFYSMTSCRKKQLHKDVYKKSISHQRNFTDSENDETFTSGGSSSWDSESIAQTWPPSSQPAQVPLESIRVQVEGWMNDVSKFKLQQVPEPQIDYHPPKRKRKLYKIPTESKHFTNLFRKYSFLKQYKFASLQCQKTTCATRKDVRKLRFSEPADIPVQVEVNECISEA